MQNTATLDQLREMQPEAVEALPTDQLYALQEAIRERASDTKALSDKLRAALIHRHGDQAERERAAKNKTTGIVHFDAPDDDSLKITGDKKIKAEWNQTELTNIRNVIANEWGGKPEEYMDIEYKVPEGKYKSWPTPIRVLFDRARVTKPGPVSIEISKKETA